VCVGIERASERARRARAVVVVTTGAVNGRTDGRSVGRRSGRGVWKEGRGKKKTEEEVQNSRCTVPVAE